MGVVELAKNVYWVGSIDYDIKFFHGYKTPYGTTYNSYLVVDGKNAILIDTVKANFYDDLLNNISEVIEPEKINYIISNHVEPDHSGALPGIMKNVSKDAKIITSPNGEKGLRAYYKEDWKFSVVKTGDILNTGKFNFSFVHTPMVHWPDNMVTYLSEENILFSNDAFGQHIASADRFDDQLGKQLSLSRAKDYYANIVLPFGGQVTRVISSLTGLRTSLVAPSHGVIWRSYIDDIIDKYSEWAENKVNDSEAVIVYDTMWGSTEILAKRIAANFEKQGIKADILSLNDYHISEVMDRLITARYICLGSPTLNRNLLPSVAAFIAYIKGLLPKNRKGIVFGSYGWSGESISIIEEAFRSCGIEVIETVKSVYVPD